MCQNYEVKKVVDGFVSKGYMFTAFDVTKFLRKSGSQIRHSDVNSAVKEMYRDGEMSSYLRDTKDVGAPVAPFVYYHQNADVDSYSTDWLENNPDQDGMKNDGDVDDGSSHISGIAQPTPSTLSVTSVSSVINNVPVTVKAIVPCGTVAIPKGVKFKKTDKDGRLYISPLVASQVGLSPYMGVSLSIDGSSIKLSSSGGKQVLMVNNDGRIRISSHILSRIAKPSVGYKVAIVGKEIAVTAV